MSALSTYGEQINHTYIFAYKVRGYYVDTHLHHISTGTMHRTSDLQIIWLDASWQTLKDATTVFTIKNKFNGHHALTSAVAPVNAHYAVPTFYKDASAGTFYADDVAFSPVSDSCPESSAKTRL